MPDYQNNNRIDPFHSRQLTEDQQQLSDIIRAEFVTLAGTLSVSLPEGRNKSLVFTKLEEAAMWAQKAVAHDTDE